MLRAKSAQGTEELCVELGIFGKPLDAFQPLPVARALDSRIDSLPAFVGREVRKERQAQPLEVRRPSLFVAGHVLTMIAPRRWLNRSLSHED